jgi:hypothetical protein
MAVDGNTFLAWQVYEYLDTPISNGRALEATSSVPRYKLND